jgi:hypothetical protein
MMYRKLLQIFQKVHLLKENMGLLPDTKLSITHEKRFYMEMSKWPPETNNHYRLWISASPTSTVFESSKTVTPVTIPVPTTRHSPTFPQAATASARPLRLRSAARFFKAKEHDDRTPSPFSPDDQAAP